MNAFINRSKQLSPYLLVDWASRNYVLFSYIRDPFLLREHFDPTDISLFSVVFLSIKRIFAPRNIYESFITHFLWRNADFVFKWIQQKIINQSPAKHEYQHLICDCEYHIPQASFAATPLATSRRLYAAHIYKVRSCSRSRLVFYFIDIVFSCLYFIVDTCYIQIHNHWLFLYEH